MRKIPTVFKRDPEDRKYVLDEVHPECGWVLRGEGRATRKWDGTCVMYDDGTHTWWARREVKPGKIPPDYFKEVEWDLITKKTFGWEPIEQSPFYKFFQQALERGNILVGEGADFVTGTYELIGPKINGNPEEALSHSLVPHGTMTVQSDTTPRTFESIKKDLGTQRALVSKQIEGFVYWHPDGRKAKIKVRDFRWDD